MVNEEYYISLIVKSVSKEISDAEQKELDTWLAESDKNVATFKEYEKIWEISEVKNDFEPDVNQAWNKFESQINTKKEAKVVPLNSTSVESKKSNKGIWLALAASVVLLIGVTVYFQVFSGSEMIRVASTNEVKSVKLPDGSLISLNKNSSIAYLEDFEDRNITFEGEAFFDIARDENRPFEISCKDSKVKVLGTSFNVNSREENKTVSVVVSTGKVELSSTKTNAKEILIKGDRGTLLLSNGQVNKSINEDKNVIAWKTNSFDFSGLSNKEIFSELEDYFDIEVKCSDDQILSEVIDTWSKEDNPKLNEIVQKIQLFYSNTEMTKDGKTLLIKR